MGIVYLRFHGELQDFLRSDRCAAAQPFPLPGRSAVKHPIEALGVPHPEVGQVCVNGCVVGFSHLLQADDNIEVYPVASFEQSTLLRPALIRPLRFVLDTHLGQLAVYLRLLGIDACYRNRYNDDELAQISHEAERILLTRDRALLMRKAVIYGHCVRCSEPRQQLIDLIRRYRLGEQIAMWRRCVHCNGLLATVEKAAILEQLEAKTQLYYDSFERCQSCGRIYWQGSHVERMKPFFAAVLRQAGGVECAQQNDLRSSNI